MLLMFLCSFLFENSYESDEYQLLPSVSNSTTIYGSEKVDLVSEILVIIGMAVFLLFANILLVNLVIADFRFLFFLRITKTFLM